MKRIFLLSTGGTIASTPGEDGRNVSGALPGEALVQALELADDVRVVVESVLQKPSNAIGSADWATIARRCEALMAGGLADGIVITHGTDTLEDTAYFLECVLDTSDVPVVVTGSQRVPHAQGSDAHANLRRAIEAAASGHSHGMGVMVAFNESLYSANFVRKVSSFRLDGFDAPGLGCLGFIDNGEVQILQRPMRQRRLVRPSALPRVDVLPVHAGASAAFLEAVLASAPAGIVIDGVGRGHVPPDWMPVLRAAMERGLPTLICSSTLHGATHQSYQFPGSLHELEDAGAVGVRHLTARKARIRLALLLANGVSAPQAIRTAFDWQPNRC
ncbi:asparaginase [Thauera propionica]|jgi:L-asparaginase|uniref:asparaginase n=1 Tax=Thauera propionica TaxID=2019431 RepID=UPI0023F2A1CF|nr:asparaginase [Thauera propionica]MDD3675571.1 asparaginase [Thauera propionica]